MPNSTFSCLTHNVTTFTDTGEFDEDAYRRSLERLVDSEIGISAAAGGSGESHSLTRDELRRVYAVTVEVAKGRVPVESCQPEQHTARLTIEHAQIAIDAGIETVGLYGPSNLHGYSATGVEYLTYFDEVLAEIKHPVMLNVIP